MKKVVLLVGVVLAALALAAVAWAAAPQGKMTGFLQFHPLGDPEGVIHKITFTTPVLDGETTFVNVSNDYSGDCSLDTGTIEIQFNLGGGGGTVSRPVDCAHFSNSNTMSFSWFEPLGALPDTYIVCNIVDRAALDPIVRCGHEPDQTLARLWVNVGTVGSGHGATPLTVAAGPKKGEVTVTASQA